MRQHPVKIAVATTVRDHIRPRQSGLQRAPQVGKRLRRHVGMAHEVVRLAEQLFLAEAAHFDEAGIGVSDLALDVGHRHDRLAVSHQVLDSGNRQIDTHCTSISFLISIKVGFWKCNKGTLHFLDLDQNRQGRCWFSGNLHNTTIKLPNSKLFAQCSIIILSLK